MNAFETAKKENGIAIVDGVTYAIGEQPSIDNHGLGVAYKAYGFSESMMDQDGHHDPLFEDHVKIAWNCTGWFNANSDGEFDCDWENSAEVA